MKTHFKVGLSTACGRDRDRTMFSTEHKPSVTCGVCRKVLGLPCAFPKPDPDFQLSDSYKEAQKDNIHFCPVNPEGWHDDSALAGGVADEILVFKRVEVPSRANPNKKVTRWRYDTECDYCGLKGYITLLETDVHWERPAEATAESPAEPAPPHSPPEVDF